ncbi:globin GlbN [Calothrix sp. NIES-4071]|nr:globin GlbN [Calothrix sp. NIES-4071]BAZ58286.1 globin GlbN [Calothrix sp. NIES-4105]
MQTLTLYDKLGGEKYIAKIVDDFYKYVLADKSINHLFANTDMEKQRRHQTAFISYALGGKKEYTGRSMEKAHAGLNIQPEHTDAVLKHLSNAMALHGLSQQEIDQVITQVSQLREAIEYK